MALLGRSFSGCGNSGARQWMREGGIPIGSVIKHDGKIIGQGSRPWASYLTVSKLLALIVLLSPFWLQTNDFRVGDQSALFNVYYSGGFMKLPIQVLLLASTLALMASCAKVSPEPSASAVTPGATTSPTLSTRPTAESSSTAQGSGNAPDSNTAQDSSPAKDSYHPVQIPSGTVVSVRLQSSISSASAQPGDRFRAVLDSPLRVGGESVVAAGSEVTGRVVAAEHSGRLQHPGFLQLELSSIHSRGREVAISTSRVSAKGASHKTRNLSWIGGGAGGGALLGGLLGGGKGALIGLQQELVREPRRQPRPGSMMLLSTWSISSPSGCASRWKSANPKGLGSAATEVTESPRNISGCNHPIPQTAPGGDCSGRRVPGGGLCAADGAQVLRGLLTTLAALLPRRSIRMTA
jgi:hypothetical protein